MLTKIARVYALQKLAASTESVQHMREYYNQNPKEYQAAMQKQKRFKAELDKAKTQKEYNDIMKKYNIRF